MAGTILPRSALMEYARQPKAVTVADTKLRRLIGYRHPDSLGHNNSGLKSNPPGSYPAVALLTTTEPLWKDALFFFFFVFHEYDSTAADCFQSIYAIAPREASASN